MSTNIASTFTSVPTGPVRNFNTRGSADLVVVFETANASNAAAGGRIKDPSAPSADLACVGAAAHSLTITDAAPYVRYVVLQGTISACWMDDAPLPDTGPAGPPGGTWNVTVVKTANYTAAAGELVQADPSGGAFTVTLPFAATEGEGARVAVKNSTTSTTAITVGKSGSDTVDGGSSASMTTSKAITYWISDGVSNWIKG